MAKYATFVCAAALAVCTTFYNVEGNDTLQKGKIYSITAFKTNLVMTAEQGLLGDHLGIVHMEKFVNATNQKWKYNYEGMESRFINEENSYNNVTTRVEKDGRQKSNGFRATSNEDNIYTLQEKSSVKNKNGPQCLQNMGEGNAVQLAPCIVGSESQLWKFQLLQCCKKQ